MSQRALITGAGGFVSHHLANLLTAQGLELWGMDRPGIACPPDWQGRWLNAEITDAEQIFAACEKVEPQFVFHLAAILKSDNLHDLLRVNVLGTQNLLDALVRLKSKVRILVAGSSSEYGLSYIDELPISESNPLRPLSPYGISKAAQSLLAAQYAYRNILDVVRVRTFNLIGPNESGMHVVSAFSQQIARIEKCFAEPILKTGNLTTARDFVDVRDAVKAYWLLMLHGQSGDVYNVASGSAVSIQEILDKLVSHSQIPIEIQVLHTTFSAWDVPIQIGDYTRTKNLTNWAPEIPLEKSILDNLEHWRSKFCPDDPNL